MFEFRCDVMVNPNTFIVTKMLFECDRVTQTQRKMFVLQKIYVSVDEAYVQVQNLLDLI